VFTLAERNLKRIIGTTYPILATHILLVLVGPIPAPRYVMATILIGYVCSLFLLSNLLAITKKNGDFK
jgi:hypothetical protein